MARLIDADALIQNHGSDVTNFDNPYAVKISSIENAPTVDDVPVVHGRWVFGSANHREYMKCSECLHSYKPDGTFCYCPNCGAKMDLEVE